MDRDRHQAPLAAPFGTLSQRMFISRQAPRARETRTHRRQQPSHRCHAQGCTGRPVPARCPRTASSRRSPDRSAALFRRQDFSNLSFEKLIAPVVIGQDVERGARLRRAGCSRAGVGASTQTRSTNVEVRLPNADGSFTTAHYGFAFTPVESAARAACWLVRVSDITQRVAGAARTRGSAQPGPHARRNAARVLTSGGARFGKFISKTDEAMKTINGVLKKPAREAEAFRSKLEETLVEVDRMRRDAAALRLEGLERAAREIRGCAAGAAHAATPSAARDFLPLAVKLDQLYGQFVTHAQPHRAGDGAPQRRRAGWPPDVPMTAGGTQIIEAPKFIEQMRLQEQRGADAAGTEASAAPQSPRGAGLPSAASTARWPHSPTWWRRSMADRGARNHRPGPGAAALPGDGQERRHPAHPQRRDARHRRRRPSAKPRASRRMARCSWSSARRRDGNFELMFQDDGRGLDPEKVRATRGGQGHPLRRRRRRTHARPPGDQADIQVRPTPPWQPTEDGAAHGTGMSLVRRYVHEAGGKIALASLLGHETRFKVSSAAAPSKTRPLRSPEQVRPARRRPPRGRRHVVSHLATTPGVRRGQRVFHLHRFHVTSGAPARHALARRHVHRHHGAGQRREQRALLGTVGPWRGCPRCAARADARAGRRETGAAPCIRHDHPRAGNHPVDFGIEASLLARRAAARSPA